MATTPTPTPIPATKNIGEHGNGANNDDINYNNAFVVLNKRRPVTNAEKRKILQDFMKLDPFDIVVSYNNSSIQGSILSIHNELVHSKPKSKTKAKQMWNTKYCASKLAVIYSKWKVHKNETRNENNASSKNNASTNNSGMVQFLNILEKQMDEFIIQNQKTNTALVTEKEFNVAVHDKMVQYISELQDQHEEELQQQEQQNIDTIEQLQRLILQERIQYGNELQELEKAQQRNQQSQLQRLLSAMIRRHERRRQEGGGKRDEIGRMIIPTVNNNNNQQQQQQSKSNSKSIVR